MGILGAPPDAIPLQTILQLSNSNPWSMFVDSYAAALKRSLVRAKLGRQLTPKQQAGICPRFVKGQKSTQGRVSLPVFGEYLTATAKVGPGGRGALSKSNWTDHVPIQTTRALRSRWRVA